VRWKRKVRREKEGRGMNESNVCVRGKRKRV